MKKTEKKVLIELLKDATRSDRAIAKVLGVSQPTVTRIKNKLVKEGIIRDSMQYQILQNWDMKSWQSLVSK